MSGIGFRNFFSKIFKIIAQGKISAVFEPQFQPLTEKYDSGYTTEGNDDDAYPEKISLFQLLVKKSEEFRLTDYGDCNLDKHFIVAEAQSFKIFKQF